MGTWAVLSKAKHAIRRCQASAAKSVKEGTGLHGCSLHTNRICMAYLSHQPVKARQLRTDPGITMSMSKYHRTAPTSPTWCSLEQNFECQIVVLMYCHFTHLNNTYLAAHTQLWAITNRMHACPLSLHMVDSSPSNPIKML